MGLLQLLFRLLLAGVGLWALSEKVFRNQRIGKAKSSPNLTGPLRLRFSTFWSSVLSGVLATPVVIAFLYVVGLLRFLLPSGRDDTVWEVPLKMYIGIVAMLVLGALAGFLRRVIRRRWPEAIPFPWATMWAGKTVVFSGGGFYLDEALVPALLLPLVLTVLSFLEYEYGSWFSIDPFLALAMFPLIWSVFLPFYIFWQWVHGGFLETIGNVNKEDSMISAALEVLLWDDHIQRWLGDVSIKVDAGQNRYIVSGMVPQGSVLSAIRRRLADIDGAVVDTSGVTVDPAMQPNYRKLTALSRAGTTASRRKAFSEQG